MTCLSQCELTYSLHSSLSCTIDLYIFFSIFPFKRRRTTCTHLHGCYGKGLTLEWLFLYFQRLHKSFKENQYPDRSTKESLAQELGLTYQQVISFSFSCSANTFLFLLWLSEFAIVFHSGCQMVRQYTLELPAFITNGNQFRYKCFTASYWWQSWKWGGEGMWINISGVQWRKIKNPKL